LAGGEAEAQSQMITKEQLIEMFESVTEKTDWNMSGNMVWGYFFTDSDRSALESVIPLLSADGYAYKDIYLAEKQSESEPDMWWLHVEKVETHSVESLYARNLAFYDFAAKHALDSYDGMDVGPVVSSGE
jgi:hypothetical protein